MGKIIHSNGEPVFKVTDEEYPEVLAMIDDPSMVEVTSWTQPTLPDE